MNHNDTLDIVVFWFTGEESISAFDTVLVTVFVTRMITSSFGVSPGYCLLTICWMVVLVYFPCRHRCKQLITLSDSWDGGKKAAVTFADLIPPEESHKRKADAKGACAAKRREGRR
jgi:hypothetical protein